MRALARNAKLTTGMVALAGALSGGSLFVYNRLVTKHYRDDGVPLRKRPDRSNSAKECHMKLKLQDRYVMNAVYASCLPDDDVRGLRPCLRVPIRACPDESALVQLWC